MEVIFTLERPNGRKIYTGAGEILCDKTRAPLSSDTLVSGGAPALKGSVAGQAQVAALKSGVATARTPPGNREYCHR